jgi:hypothetical protein
MYQSKLVSEIESVSLPVYKQVTGILRNIAQLLRFAKESRDNQKYELFYEQCTDVRNFLMQVWDFVRKSLYNTYSPEHVDATAASIDAYFNALLGGVLSFSLKFDQKIFDIMLKTLHALADNWEKQGDLLHQASSVSGTSRMTKAHMDAMLGDGLLA